jgi:tetratricopeptide (TPR) repeat protein
MALAESANVGKTVAARVGKNIREVRVKLELTQAQLAAPEFSISYISAIERGKIRPSLRALSVLAKRLDVPLTFLLDGSPEGVKEAQTVGYSPADSGPDQRVDVDLLQAGVFIQQHLYKQASELLTAIHPERVTVDQAYRLFFLRGQVHLGMQEYQEAVVDLRAALIQGDGMGDSEYSERARNLLGRAYFFLYNYTLALEHHLRCLHAIENGDLMDPVFALDVYNNLANDYFRHGDLEQAVTFYQRALGTLAETERNPRSFAQKYMEIGQGYKSLGKLAVARDYMLRSLSLYEMCEEQRLEGLSHQRLGKTLEKQGDLTGAEMEYRVAIGIERELEDAVASALCHTSLAELLLKSGKIQESEQEARHALDFARQAQDAQTEGQALMTLAQIRHQAQDFAEADQLFQQALALLESSCAHELAASAYFRYANLLEERREVQRSLDAVKKAFEHQRLGKRGEIE